MPNSFLTPWTAACQTPLSVGFPRQEYWSVAIPFSNPGIKPVSPALAGGFFPTEPPGKPYTACWTKRAVSSRSQVAERRWRTMGSHGGFLAGRWCKICVSGILRSVQGTTIFEQGDWGEGRKQKQKQSSEKKAKFGVLASNKATLNMSRYEIPHLPSETAGLKSPRSFAAVNIL